MWCPILREFPKPRPLEIKAPWTYPAVGTHWDKRQRLRVESPVVSEVPRGPCVCRLGLLRSPRWKRGGESRGGHKSTSSLRVGTPSREQPGRCVGRTCSGTGGPQLPPPLGVNPRSLTPVSRGSCRGRQNHARRVPTKFSQSPRLTLAHVSPSSPRPRVTCRKFRVKYTPRIFGHLERSFR